jgi:two-component system NarL family sensor kinase
MSRMKRNAPKPSAESSGSPGQFAELRARLAEAEGALRAIRSGEVDAVVVTENKGLQVFTLEGAGHAYRLLIESMNEGALTLTADKMILYANQRFARMVRLPLEQVTGSSLRRFLSDADRAKLKLLLSQPNKSGSKMQVLLNPAGGSPMPAQISIRPLARNGMERQTFGLVVTDLTETRRTEELLRALTRRVVQAQETERGRVALELHDNITQLLCGILVRCQTLAEQLSTRDGPLKGEAVKLRQMIGHAAEEVERISRNLRPGVLDELGLIAVLRETSTEFASRTGVSLTLACAPLDTRLPAGIELTLYRILQEALKNVEKHARAGRVSVSLRKLAAFVELAIADDGVGFDPEHRPARRKKKGSLGLLGMRERAAYVDGVLEIKSTPGKGTAIHAQIPLTGVNTP